MQALYVEEGQVRYVPDHEKPVAGEGQALIRVKLAGICSTDLEIVKGYANFEGILGHEFVGVVEDGPVHWLAQRVVGSINIGCGVCERCLGSGSEHCTSRTVLGIIGHDGAFADYLVLPVVNLHRVPDNVPDEQAVFTEPLAAALRIREQIMVPPSARIAVIGPGRLGMLVGMVLSGHGARLTMIGRSGSSLRLPTQMGLTTGMASECEDDCFDIVVEATGNRQGLKEALRLVRPLGTLVLKSTYAESTDIDLTKVVVGELTVIGSRCGPFAPAVRALKQGEIDVSALVDGEYALRDGRAALQHAAQRGVRKILLRP